ncbi:MAG: hypothetical protein AAF416_23060 [Pseudomonadota bacterium]
MSQDSYIQSSVMMAGVIGSQIKPEIARCIDGWYFRSAAAKEAANDRVRGAITRYADHHPSGVILAVVQQECGTFK